MSEDRQEQKEYDGPGEPTIIGRFKVLVKENGNMELRITRGLKVDFTPYEVVALFMYLASRMPFFHRLINRDRNNSHE